MGRDPELTTISQSIAEAADGRATVVWVEGGAGFGKTALVRQAVAAAPPEFIVLTAEADEFAGEQQFSVTSQLGASSTAGSFAVGMELLRLAGERDDHRPVLLVVEDLHWADVGSRQALAVLARRLDSECVTLVVTTRPGMVGDGWDRLIDDEICCRTIRLGPVSDGTVERWASRVGVRLTAAQATRLHRHTGGHPLYLKTLLGELTPSQLASNSQPLPAPRSLAWATNAALAELSEDAQHLAWALAVLGRRTPLPVVARVADVAQPAAALEALLPTGFVDWSPADPSTLIDFAHPLYRLAVYDELSPTRRRALHLAAAANLGHVAGLPHRVTAADACDDALADELDDAVANEIARGAIGLAAKYLLWAAPLTTVRRTADARLLRGARLLLADGQLDRVGDMLDSLRSCDPGPLRDLVLGSYAYESGDAETARNLLSSAASQDGADVSVRSDAYARLGTIYLLRGEPHHQASAAEAALSIDGADAQSLRTAWGSLAAAEFSLKGAPAGLAVLDRRLPEHPADVTGADAELLVVRGLLQLYAAHTRVGTADLRAAIRLSRDGFAQQHLPAAHVYLARALYVLGDWDEALVHARAAQAIVTDDRLSWIRGRAESVLGTVAAARGSWQDAHACLVIAQEAARGSGDSAWAELVAGLVDSAICRAKGDAAGVVAALRPFADDPRALISQMAVVAWWPVLIDALVDIGEITTAAAEVHRLERHMAATGLDIGGQVAGMHARLAAAAGDPDEAAQRFEIAITTLRPDDPLLDRALVRQRYGRLLRARGNRRDAVHHFRAAHEMLAAVGADPYLKSVTDDLAACGIRTAAGSSALDLTEREQDVVVLVRKGLTNKEIATEMYVSEKAVEYHLRNVYGKLGIGSRRELRARV